MALTTNELLIAVTTVYDGADVWRESGSLNFHIKTIPPRELIFDQKYFEAHVDSANSFTVDELVADIHAKKVTATSAKNMIIDMVR